MLNDCALRLAAENGHLEVCRLLIECGAYFQVDFRNIVSLFDKHTFLKMIENMYDRAIVESIMKS